MLGELKAQGVTDLRAYMDEHPDFVVRALEATIVTDINQKSIELYGLRDKSDALGKSILGYWLPGRYEAFEGSIEAGFNGKSQFQMVTRTRTFDGREVDCRFWMAAPPEMRASGTVMVAIQDLTEEIASRREIESLREGLAHAGRVLMLGSSPPRSRMKSTSRSPRSRRPPRLRADGWRSRRPIWSRPPRHSPPSRKARIARARSSTVSGAWRSKGSLNASLWRYGVWSMKRSISSAASCTPFAPCLW
jgi:PAS domain S-box-containing protein